jgi:phosphate uptake regulator
VDDLHINPGDSLLFREETDGTIRLIPATDVKTASKVTIKADQIEDVELLSRLIISSYALGYDTIEIVGKGRLGLAEVDRSRETIKRLRGLEVVEAEDNRIVAQSFMDPTKFPVDSLIKRLQVLVSRSLDAVIDAMDLRNVAGLNGILRIQDEMDELYWLIVRQLLVALSRKEMASEIGIESPLHASGDRVMAKAMEEVGNIIVDISQELMRLRTKGTSMDKEVATQMRELAIDAREAFNTTAKSLMTPDINLIKESVRLIYKTFELEKKINLEILESGQHDYSRILVSYFGQLARYCNMMTEIAFHRFLRKTSRVAVIQNA